MLLGGGPCVEMVRRRAYLVTFTQRRKGTAPFGIKPGEINTIFHLKFNGF
jgi:hypothetical protein